MWDPTMKVPDDVEKAAKELADKLGEFTTQAYGLGKLFRL